MKQVKLLNTKTAVIILSIFILLLMIALFIFFDKTYQKQTETYPQISVYYKDKEIGKMAVIKSNWLYKGHGENTDLGNYYDYDFPEENIVLVANNDTQNYVMKSDFRYKTIYHSNELRKVDGFQIVSMGQGNGDYSPNLKKGMGMCCTNGIGELIYSIRFTYQQGTVDYAIKLISFDEKQAELGKKYLNTSISDTQKIEELIKSARYGTAFNSCKVEGKNLTIEYDNHISEDYNLKMHNVLLFACIPEIETITYSPKNKKTFYNDTTGPELVVKTEEVEKRVYTKEQVNSEDLANSDNLKKFMEQI